MLFNDLGVDHQVGGHVLIEVQNGVGGQESLRHGDALVGRVVQGALKPLQAGGHGRVEPVGDDVPGQGADALASHGIALVGHGGGADLVLLKGLLHLLKGLEDAQVVGELAGGLGHPGQRGEHIGVGLPGIGLAADGHALGKAHLLCHQAIQLAHLRLVPFEQLHKAGLGAGGALDSPQAQGVQLKFQVFQVHHQLIHPQRGPLANGGQLGGLEVGVAQAGQILVLPGKSGKVPQHLDDLPGHQGHGVPEDEDIGVVPHIAGGGAQVDNGLGVGTLLAIGVDVAHHVVAHQLLPGFRHVVVDVVGMGLQLVDLLLGDRKAQLPLRLGQGDPELPPGAEFMVLREQILHLTAGIAGGERGDVPVAVSFHGAPPYWC